MSGQASLVQSIQTRLLTHARSIGVDPNLVLTRYAIERFLYRLSLSAHAERFVLKGGLLMLAWLGETLRPTRDIDLLGYGELGEDTLTTMFTQICAVPVEADGICFIADSIRVDPIRLEDAYGGQRITLAATLGAARLPVQVDVGIGDATVPEPTWLEYPGLLDLQRPRLRAYAPETVVAEKLHAIVLLGLRNSRMKDYFDLHALAREGKFQAGPMSKAIHATFERRRTPFPPAWPQGLGEDFAGVSGKVAQWQAFLTRNRLSAPSLDQVVTEIRTFLEPSLALARQHQKTNV
jgi:hypothetical protein